MKRHLLFFQVFLLLLAVPSLACGPAALQVTPTPTKTPRRVQTLPPPTATATVAVIQIATPTPLPPTDTPTPLPPTDTPTPLPATDTPTPLPPTNTPVPPPPPPPTNTPVPPPTQPPAEPPPTQPPPSNGPVVVIDLPKGDTFRVGDDVAVRITVSDPDGVSTFTWGLFTENRTSLKSGNQNCGGANSCDTNQKFEAPLPGAFFIGVEALDRNGEKTIVTRAIYVG